MITVPGMGCFSGMRVTVIVDHAVMVNSYRREHWDGVPVFPGLVHRYPRFSSASSRFHQERPFG